jgi:predicted Zn-dependent protease
MRTLLLAAVCVAAAACTGENRSQAPAAPTVPAPASRTILVRDGATSEVIGELSPQPVGSRLSASVPGYLPRLALFHGDDVFLWPQEESYVTTLVYTGVDDRVYSMGRWASRSLTVGAPDDPRTLDAVRGLVAEAASAAGIALAVVPGAGDITVDVNASEFGDNNWIAFTRYEAWSGWELRRVRIFFRDNNDLVGSRKAVCTNTLLHELGHALGFFGHSPVAGEMMNADCWKRTSRGFSANERLALWMMYQHRRAGNRVPDTEAGVSATTDRARPVEVE